MEFDDAQEQEQQENQSYFSSQVHSSSETINSDLIMACQNAISKQGGLSDDIDVNIPLSVTEPRASGQHGDNILVL